MLILNTQGHFAATATTTVHGTPRTRTLIPFAEQGPNYIAWRKRNPEDEYIKANPDRSLHNVPLHPQTHYESLLHTQGRHGNCPVHNKLVTWKRQDCHDKVHCCQYLVANGCDLELELILCLCISSAFQTTEDQVLKMRHRWSKEAGEIQKESEVKVLFLTNGWSWHQSIRSFYLTDHRSFYLTNPSLTSRRIDWIHTCVYWLNTHCTCHKCDRPANGVTRTSDGIETRTCAIKDLRDFCFNMLTQCASPIVPLVPIVPIVQFIRNHDIVFLCIYVKSSSFAFIWNYLPSCLHDYMKSSSFVVMQ